jgi:hypothetical protein
MGLFGNGQGQTTQVNPVSNFDVEVSPIPMRGKGHYILPGPELLRIWYGVKHTALSSFVLHYENGNEKVALYLSKTENHNDLPDAGRCSFGYASFEDEKRNFLIVWIDSFQKLVGASTPAGPVMIFRTPQSIQPLLDKVSFPGNEKLGQTLHNGKMPISNIYLVQSRSFMSEVVCSLMYNNQEKALSPREVMLNKLKSMSSDKTYSRNDLEALGIKPQNVSIAIENLKFPVLEEIERGTFVFYAHTLQRYTKAAAEREAEEQGFREKSVRMKGTDGKTYRLGANEDGVIDGSVAETIEGDE